MKLVCDLHVHIYPEYDFSSIWSTCQKNLGKYQGQKIIALTERQDCNLFKDLVENPNKLGQDFDVSPSADGISVKISKEGQNLVLVAGHQINTIEKLELLALCCNQKIPSNLSWTETFNAIKSAGGIPVINWAPGKWWFKRGKLIREIIKCEKDFLLCDTALRFVPYPFPCLMKLAQKKNIKIIYGSDPLPINNNEKRIGTYLSLIDLETKHNSGSTADGLVRHGSVLREALLNPNVEIYPTGKRLNLFDFMEVMFRYYTNRN